MNKKIGSSTRAAILVGLVILAGMGEIKERKSIKEGTEEQLRQFSKELEEELKKAELADFPKIIIEKAKGKITAIDLRDLWDTYAFPAMQNYIRDMLSRTSPYKNTVAMVSDENKSLKPGKSWEGSFLSRRADKIEAALNRYLSSPVDSAALPVIGCALSGGGYRAMVVTAGFLKAFEDLGLLDAVTYISSLSGSTWYVGPWTLMQNPSTKNLVSVGQFNQKIRDKISAGTLNLLSKANQRSFSLERLANDIVFPKVVFEQVVSTVDMYGALLAHALLSDFGDLQQRQRLSNQWFSVNEGNNPWPLYTAISMAKDDADEYRYNWYEFTPEEVRNLELGFAIPSFAFGRSFNNGKSIDFAPEQSFGFLMGIFGSAYTVNAKDIRAMVNAGPIKPAEEELVAKTIVEGAQKEDLWTLLNPLQNKINYDAVKIAVTKMILDSLSDSRVGAIRAAPGQVRNPFKGYNKSHEWMKDRDQLTFVDAGINYNIPIRPLMRPDRNLNLIFISDASSNAIAGTELQKMFDDVKRVSSVEYKKDELLSDGMLQVYRPIGKDKPAPIILYFHFFPNEEFMKKTVKDPELNQIIEKNNLSIFSMDRCIENDFCSTFNFAYTQEDFNQLSGVAELVVKAHRGIIKDILNEIVFEREEQIEFGGGL